MNVVFLVANYEPYCDPTTRIAKKCMTYFVNRGDHVSVISIATINSKLQMVDEGKNIIAMYNKQEIKEQKNENYWAVMVSKIRHTLVFPHGFRWYVENAIQEIEKLEKELGVDALVAVSAPYAAILVGQRWKCKHPQCRLINYIVDPYRFTSKIERLFYGRTFNKIESCAYLAADYNLVFDGIKDSINALPEAKTSILYTQIDVGKRYCKRQIHKRIKVQLAYSGGFYYEFRNPSFMMEVLDMLPQNQVEIHIYSNGSCADLLDPFYNKSNSVFVKEQWVEHDELQEKLRGMDFLLNISNGISGFQPSKLFEYIATGLPIISFYTNGLKEEILGRYPLSIQIDCDNESKDEALQKIDEFMLKNLDKRISPEEIEKLFPMHSKSYFHRTMECMCESLFDNGEEND